ncbi:MAG: ATP-binding protein [Woeseiaceae bacterium]|nr:ATP-binding protein [Woeseiaceae bacterium]
MRSLLVRIFLSFWSIIVITIVAGAALGYFYAERARTAMQNFEVSDAMLEASATLREEGREGLTTWLESLPGSTASLIYILDDRGKDLLGRRLPPPVAIAMARFGARDTGRRQQPREFGNLRPARPFTQLVGPDDRVYTFFVLPPQGAVGRWMAQRGGSGIIVLALLISAAISFLLARTISRPVRRMRESALAIAGGDLDTRVSEYVGKRRDEIGLLAHDFDRMADELGRAWARQTELTRNVSHELRSPLARLRVALELARRKTGDLPELDKIDAETERLDELIGQILEFSRLGSDFPEDRSSTALEELLQSVIEDVRYEYGKTKIEFEAGSRPLVSGYRSALQSGFENVVRNAARHNRNQGEVRIRLETVGADAVVTIEDQGGGVAESELENIFEPFYRAKETQYGESKRGSGLGLAIASRAIALNNGTLSARNGEHGLSVEIRLPIERI